MICTFVDWPSSGLLTFFLVFLFPFGAFLFFFSFPFPFLFFPFFALLDSVRSYTRSGNKRREWENDHERQE